MLTYNMHVIQHVFFKLFLKQNTHTFQVLDGFHFPPFFEKGVLGAKSGVLVLIYVVLSSHLHTDSPFLSAE